MLFVSTIIKREIMLITTTNLPKKKFQKNSISLCNFYVNDWIYKEKAEQKVKKENFGFFTVFYLVDA